MLNNFDYTARAPVQDFPLPVYYMLIFQPLPDPTPKIQNSETCQVGSSVSTVKFDVIIAVVEVILPLEHNLLH